MERKNQFTFHNSSMPSRSYDFFQTMRNDTELCDITLRIGKKSISAHRLIIAAAIPYFRASFSRKASGSEESEVDFPDVDPAAIESLLEYAYTCEIVITTENVKNLLYGACRLHMEEIREACCNFLADRLHPENVLNIRNFASDLTCTNLMRETDIYVVENFADISKNEEFLNLPFSYVNQLVESDELLVASEEEVFEIVMKWVKKCPEQRKEHLPELLKAVRMPLLSPLYLKKHVAKEDLIRMSFPCRDLLDEARDFQNFPEERSVCSFSTVARRCAETFSESSAPNEERIYAIYGEYVYTATHLENAKTVWNENEGKTLLYYGTSSAVVSDKLYLLRGHDVISYEPRSNEFEFWEAMPCSRLFAGAAQLSGKIYVCGGITDSLASNIVECYVSETNKWEKIANMREVREYPGVAALGKCIYVSGGGFGISVVHSSVEKYDTRDGRWRFVPPMLSERYGHGFTELNGQLYACGGKKSNLKCTTSAEVFDPVKNTWSFVAPMNSARYRFKLLPYCGKLYAIGGDDDESKSVCTVEIYDPTTNEWACGDEIDSTYFVSAEVMTSPTA